MKTLKLKRINRPRPPKPLTARKLVVATLKEFGRAWKGYALVVTFIAVPLDLLTLAPTIATDPGVNAYATVAFILMNVALTWAIIEFAGTGKVPRPLAAYYSGTGAFVRYVVTSFCLVTVLIPAAFGAVVYLASLYAIEASVSIAEPILIGFVCLLLAAVSVWFLIRFAFALTAVVAADMRPLAALAYSRRLTLGRFWKVAARLAALIGLIVVVAVPIALITYLLSVLKLGPIASLFFEIATTAVALPIFNIYLLRLYRDLQREVITQADAQKPISASESDHQPEPKPEPEASAEPAPTPELKPEPSDEPFQAAKTTLSRATGRTALRRMDTVRAVRTLRNQASFGERLK